MIVKQNANKTRDMWWGQFIHEDHGYNAFCYLLLTNFRFDYTASVVCGKVGNL